jgi:hypothetical protein
MFINNDADDDRIAFQLLSWLREASRLERASEHDE